ncbi:MAG: restriction endonuclease subunit S [Pseudomonadota bacterium]
MVKKMNKIEKLIDELCPDGVGFKKLDKIAVVDKGKQLNKELLFEDGKFPVLNGGINPSGYWNEYNFDENKIAISQGGASAGFVNFVTKKFWAGAHCYVVLPNEDIVINRYLYFYIKSKQETIQNSKLGAGIPGLNKKEIEQLLIPIPPLNIQKEITKILDNFTTLEAELEAELEARRKQYTYYRDTLLDIKGEDYKTLGDIGIMIRGNGLQKKDFTETGVGCIHYGQIYTYYGTFADTTKTFVSSELAKKLKKAQKGDVLIAGVSENIEDVCKPLGWLGDEICISGDMFAFRHNQNTKFITYLLQTTNFHRYKERYAQGAKVTRVKTDKILDYKIPIPSLSEQDHIVSILDKFDALVNDISIGLPAELNARRKQYEYYRNQLLTFKPLENQDVH